MTAYIFDMDGVIWDGDTPIPHASEKINSIIDSGAPYIFMTNNALRKRDSYVERLADYGISTDKEHIIVSSYAAGQYIRERKNNAKVFVMGTDDLADEIMESGHMVVAEGADYVVNGLDKTVNYEKLSLALQNLLSGAELITCAPDVTYLDNGKTKMGSGAFAKALEAASGKKATVIGKPSPTIMKIALSRLGVDASECIAIGDKLPTDILAGNREGMTTVLVLTGETKKEDVDESDIKADYVIDDLRDLP